MEEQSHSNKGVVLAGLSLITIIIFFANFTFPDQGALPVVVAMNMADGLLPVHIIIPKVDVRAIVIPVGLSVDGVMGTPDGPENAGWFDRGPRPGEIGSAVIDGHSGWKNGVRSVFDELHLVENGDMIYIIDGKGATTTFIVRSARVYGGYEDTSSVFNSPDNLAHLNLITCGGFWDEVSESYSDRLVVFADKH